jgi:hypothetical protein
MSSKLSKTQIDQLGHRLREGDLIVSDLELLDSYRRTFGVAYDRVIRLLREQLVLEPTGRPAKSTSSIIEKLRRESIRLTQVQDIAGCRIIVSDIAEQDRVVAAICEAFPDASVIDRRQNPSHGYRAVHVIARTEGKLVEAQIRTSLQHLWAELSEKFSDMVDPAIKYGGGEPPIRALLTITSRLVAETESIEKDFLAFPQHLPIPKVRKLPGYFKEAIAEVLGLMIDNVESKRENQ